jgi:hypothetical protein
MIVVTAPATSSTRHSFRRSGGGVTLIFFLVVVAISLPFSYADSNQPPFLVQCHQRSDRSNPLFIRGGGIVPAGYNPFGYKITSLGERFLSFEGSLDSDVGRFLSSLKTKRKSKKDLKSEWVEIVKVSKKGQSTN